MSVHYAVFFFLLRNTKSIHIKEIKVTKKGTENLHKKKYILVIVFFFFLL